MDKTSAKPLPEIMPPGVSARAAMNRRQAIIRRPIPRFAIPGSTPRLKQENKHQNGENANVPGGAKGADGNAGNADRLRQIAESLGRGNRAADNGGPITGNDYAAWSNSCATWRACWIRQDLRNQLATVRDRLGAFRGGIPQWARGLPRLKQFVSSFCCRCHKCKSGYRRNWRVSKTQAASCLSTAIRFRKIIPSWCAIYEKLGAHGERIRDDCFFRRPLAGSIPGRAGGAGGGADMGGTPQPDGTPRADGCRLLKLAGIAMLVICLLEPLWVSQRASRARISSR